MRPLPPIPASLESRCCRARAGTGAVLILSRRIPRRPVSEIQLCKTPVTVQLHEGGRMKINTSFETKASPEQVVAALTDFTERRPDIWKPTLDPEKYEVYEVGATTARVREGSKTPSVWAIEHYDWSDPGRVTISAEESNFCKPGSGIEYTITEGADGGSHVELNWHREPSNFKGWMILAPMKLVGASMLKKGTGRALDRYADTSAG